MIVEHRDGDRIYWCWEPDVESAAVTAEALNQVPGPDSPGPRGTPDWCHRCQCHLFMDPGANRPRCPKCGAIALDESIVKSKEYYRDMARAKIAEWLEEDQYAPI